MARPVFAVDFETEAIADRPAYPPRPVGVAIAGPGRPAARYFAWGHPSGNNATLGDVRSKLAELWRAPDAELVFQNGKFDLDVAETHLGLALPDWRRTHDTLFLAFLADPHSASLSLKGSPAVPGLLERYLGVGL